MANDLNKSNQKTIIQQGASPFAWILSKIFTLFKYILIIVVFFSIIGALFFLGVGSYRSYQSGQAGSLITHTSVGLSEPAKESKGFLYTISPTLYSFWTGDYQKQLSFDSDVEANANNRNLGVKIKNLEALPSTVYEQDPIRFTGSVSAASIGEDIKLSATCRLEGYNHDRPIPAKLYGSTTTKSNEAVIFKDANEELVAECLFPDGVSLKNNKVNKESKVGKLSIVTEYFTEASQTVYFMSQSEYLTIRSKNQDPFIVKKIKNPQLRSDRRIDSIYTAGPAKVKVGIDLPQPFVDNRPYILNVQLSNAIGDTGMIQRINAIVLELPNVPDLRLVLEGTAGYSSSTSVDTCDFEFVGPGEEGFDIYQVKEEKLVSINKDCGSADLKSLHFTEKQCIDFFRANPTFTCAFKADRVPKELQYDTIRVRAKYLYQVERSSVVDVIKALDFTNV